MACGLPLIITPVGGSDELIKNNGFIVERKNPDQIAEKLEELYSDKSLRFKMAKNSRHLAEKMTWKKVADKYMGVYEN